MRYWSSTICRFSAIFARNIIVKIGIMFSYQSDVESVLEIMIPHFQSILSWF